MKSKKIIIPMATLLLSASLCACGGKTGSGEPSSDPATAPTAEATVAPTETPSPTPSPEPEFIDYAATLKLDMSTDSIKTKATVRTFVDGDTVHFDVPTSVESTGLLKARFLAINTPESTGKIEEYGKAASKYTRAALEKATSIILESDDSNWNLDSTGGRYLVWVWYKTAEDPEYRNLNVEILQNGLAIASNTANNRYGSTAIAALTNAKACKLNLYSGLQDPDFFYGDAYELTLKELRLNVAEYNGKKVAFEGVVTVNSDSTVYVEDYDPNTDLYYGISVFYGYNLSGAGLEILKVGNRVRIVGSCQYYEAGGTYQIADVAYKIMKPNDPSNLQLIGSGYEGAFVTVDPKRFAEGKVEIEQEDSEGNVTKKEYAYADLIQGTTVSIEDLDVVSIYTTSNPASSSNGAMTLHCVAQDGTKIDVRTVVLYDDNRELITASAYQGRTISVKGIVEHFDGSYQIKVLSEKYITIIH
ncbi:MAG: thermonuclease family protein [Lachnospiraceae bacterium]|nr:thermonuclease family protein [Lachnospiraceae bacterium]